MQVLRGYLAVSLIWQFATQTQDRIKAVVFGGLVVFDRAALGAAVDEDIIAAFDGKSHWLHQAATVFGAIAWVYIDVLAPEAFGAVVGVAIALHGKATISASKIFNVPLEFFVHLGYRAKAIRVLHPQQAETTCRSCGTGCGAVAAGEQVGDGLRWLRTAADFDHRADENPHHVAEEAVGLDFKDQFGAALRPDRVKDVAGQVIGNGILFAKGPKSAFAAEGASGHGHGGQR